MLLLTPSVSGLFKWRQFEPEVILLAVGWYLRFSLSYRVRKVCELQAKTPASFQAPSPNTKICPAGHLALGPAGRLPAACS